MWPKLTSISARMESTSSVISTFLFVFLCVPTLSPITCQNRRRPSPSQGSDILFPGERPRLGPGHRPDVIVTGDSGTNKIPEEVLIRMKDIQNISEFLKFVQDGYPLLPDQGIETAYLTRNDQQSADISSPQYGFATKYDQPESSSSNITGKKGLSGGIPSNAGCMPNPEIVVLEKPKDPAVVQWPMCVRVNRCSGCCTSALVECVPTKKSFMPVKVIRARYLNDKGSFTFDGNEERRIEKHDVCRCECRQKAEDCNSRQIYKAERCSCVCLNDHEAASCKTPEKIWDPDTCTCRCKNQHDCSTGSFFNKNTCRCESMRASLAAYPEPTLRRLRMSAAVGSLRSLEGEKALSPYGRRYRNTGIHPDEEAGPFATLPRSHDDPESRKIRISDAELASTQLEATVADQAKTARDESSTHEGSAQQPKWS